MALKNKLISLWIVLYSVLTTLYYASAVLFSILTRRSNRELNNYHIRRWAWHLLDVLKLKYKIYNPYQVDFIKPSQNMIVMCNHSSLYDIPLSLVAIPGTLRMLAKKELSRIPVFGAAMKKSEFVFIDRNNRAQAILDLAEAKAKMETGVIMWISPEGTRSNDGQLLPLKKGGFMIALETGATIVPIGIRGVRQIVEKKTLKFNRHQKVEVHIGKPIDASRYTVKDRMQLIKEVEHAIKEAAGLNV